MLRPVPRIMLSGMILGIPVRSLLVSLAPRRRAGLGLGFGWPSSVAEAVRVRVSGRVTVADVLPVMAGASLAGSYVPLPAFSEMTPLLTSHAGLREALAFRVR